MNSGIKVTKKKSIVTIKPEGDFTINYVNELRECLVENIESLSELEMDLSKVEKIDTAGFQLLLLARREIEAENKIFRIINPSANVERIFNLYEEQL